MKQQEPLITMRNKSLEGERQTKLQKERQSKSVICCKSFLLGSSIGFALQVMACVAYYTLFKMFGKDTNPTPGSLLSWFSYYMLVLISQLQLAIYIATWLTAMYTSTKSGSLYMRKKFDKDATNPNSGSIWTTRLLFIVGNYFLLGVLVGAFSLRVIVYLLCIGMVMPWMPLFRSKMIDFVTFLFITVWWFDWRDSIDQEELGDDLSFVA
jgi:hypothetical protein